MVIVTQVVLDFIPSVQQGKAILDNRNKWFLHNGYMCKYIFKELLTSITYISVATMLQKKFLSAQVCPKL